MAEQAKSVEAKPERASAAEAAKAPAVGSAEALLREAVQGSGREAQTVPAPTARMKPDTLAWLRGRAALGAGFAVAVASGVVLGGGGLAAYHRLERADQHHVTAAEWKRIAARLETSGSEGGRVAGDLKLLKDQIAALREQSERGRTEANARAAQTAERLNQLQKADKDAGERLTTLSERLDRLDRDAAARVAALGERIEKRLPAPAAAPVAAAPATVAPVAAVPAKPVAEDRTGSIPDPKAKPPTLDAWILRDVFEGVAVVEGRNQRLVEVAPGEMLPGGGRVESIERRGKAWVVVTSKGVITSQAW